MIGKSYEITRNGRHYGAFNNLVSVTCCRTLFIPLEKGQYTCADCGAKFEVRERAWMDMPPSA